MNKKILATFIAINISIIGMGQFYKEIKPFIDFGPKFIIGPSLMKNADFSYDTSRTFQHKFNSFGFKAGFKFALDFNQHLAIVGEYLISNNTQNFIIDGEARQIKAKGFEIPIMLRFNKENDTYVETGIVLSNTSSVTEAIMGQVVDFSDLYSKKNKGIVFGVGGYLFGVENWGVSTGFRFRYDLDDMVNPDNDKTEANPIYALDSRTGITNNISLMFVLEFNYDLGFTMANSSCGKTRKLLFTSGRR